MRSCEAFRALSSEQVLFLVVSCISKRFSASESLWVQDQEPSSLLIILQGSAIVSTSNSTILKRLGPSDSVMIGACLLHEAVPVSVLAATSVHVCFIPRETLLMLLREDPAFMDDICEAIEQERLLYLSDTQPHAFKSGSASLRGEEKAQGAVRARLKAQGAPAAFATLCPGTSSILSPRFSFLEACIAGDQITDVIYSQSRTCLVVLLLTGKSQLWLEAVGCQVGEGEGLGGGTFLMRFCDSVSASCWAQALRKCVHVGTEVCRGDIGKLCNHGCSPSISTSSYSNSSSLSIPPKSPVTSRSAMPAPASNTIPPPSFDLQHTLTNVHSCLHLCSSR